jgi:hypothetical protein
MRQSGLNATLPAPSTGHDCLFSPIALSDEESAVTKACEPSPVSDWSPVEKYLRPLARCSVLALTLSRLGIGLAVALLVANHASPIIALLLLLVFASADVIDGDIARRLMVESALRKAMDASIDRAVVIAQGSGVL